MNTKTGLEFFRKMNKKPLYKLVDDIDANNENYVTYYCANVVEKTFDCDATLTFKKGGGFGANYRYCSNCYAKWDKLRFNKN
jgi:hypothetical protein